MPTPHRFNRPDPRDRWFVAAFVAYYLIGVASNTTQLSRRFPESLQSIMPILSVLAVLAWTASGIWSLLRAQSRASDWGFVLSSTRARVLALIAAGYVGFLIVRSAYVSVPPIYFALAFVAVLVEEVVFRPLLIDHLSRFVGGFPHPVPLAVVLSALVWALAHVPSKPFPLVVGLFLTGLIIGALYAYSGSNVLGFVAHASANTGTAGAGVMLTLFVALALLQRDPLKGQTLGD